MNVKDLDENFTILLVSNFCGRSKMLSAIKETKLEPPLDQQIPILEKMVQDSQLEMRALLLHLRPLGLKTNL